MYVTDKRFLDSNIIEYTEETMTLVVRETIMSSTIYYYDSSAHKGKIIKQSFTPCSCQFFHPNEQKMKREISYCEDLLNELTEIYRMPNFKNSINVSFLE